MNQMFFGKSKVMLFRSNSGSTPPTSREVTRIWWSNDENDYSDCPSNDGAFDSSCIPDGKYKTDAVKIEFGSDVTSIGDQAFFNCSDLTSVKIPDSVTSIGYDAFQGCSETIYDKTTIPGVSCRWLGYQLDRCTFWLSELNKHSRHRGEGVQKLQQSYECDDPRWCEEYWELCVRGLQRSYERDDR